MPSLIERAHSHLILIDIQEKLLPTIHAIESVIARTHFLIFAARHLGIPITITEQYPKGLGLTDSGLLAASGPDAVILAKTAFSGLRDDAIQQRLVSLPARRQLILVGIEAHVCVLQTALDAVNAGYDVFVVSDAISSRKASDADLARQRLTASGVAVVSAEMAFFEWLERSGTPDFKALSPLLR